MKTKFCFILALAFAAYSFADAGAAPAKTSIGKRVVFLQSI